MFENKSQPVLSRARWRRRVACSAAFAGALLVLSMGIGTLGLHFLGPLGWQEAAFNAALILGGMGLVDHIESSSGKLFAGCFVLFADIVFVGIAGILVAPWAHRLLHTFHADLD
ncbi:hypothetical protein [Rhodoligotrophos defluvii]|uniref:hypothetical protein n=1 Tax=Rhodoligotrophos defluvii TaxID=2561934 RepID=UPI0010C9C9F9|nr:hypothetical protein [Rhodoligotrophos defluvii]